METKRMAALLTMLLALSAAVVGAADEPEGVARIRLDAAALRAHVTSELARDFLAVASDLPHVSPRTIYRDPQTRVYYSNAEAEKLDAATREKLEPRSVDETFYYNTKYGTPLAYVRPLELLGQSGLGGVAGKKVVDFGYGAVGHLRMLAALGADVVGVDVDTLLPALYGGPDDQGAVSASGGRSGRVTLVHGQFPADEAVVARIGEGYDLFISKNTLKQGYLHPARAVDERLLVHLGVGDEAFVRAVFRMLRPGGRVMIYNLYPAQAPPDQPYKPWADGQCPFAPALWEAAGFRVVAFDVNDDLAARAMGRALGWDQGEGAMDLQNDLFALYSIFEKPH